MPDFDMVFEGGGAKGSVFAGAMQEFEERGHAARRLIGTSAGAISATLLAAGYRSGQLLEMANEKVDGKPRFSTFMDIPDDFEDEIVEDSLTYAIFKKVDLPGIPNMAEGFIDKQIFKQLMKLDAYREVFSFVERGGLYAGDKFLEWIREKLDADGRNLGTATFSEFHQQTGKDLSLVVSNTTKQAMQVLNHRTAPGCPVAWGVRMSMSIPFVWQEVIWDPAWGQYRDMDISESKIVDGGVLSNFPVDLLTSKAPHVTAVMGDDVDPDDAPNLGLLIDENLSVEGSGDAVEDAGGDDTGEGLLHNVHRLKTVQRIRRLVNTMTNAHDNRLIAAHEKEICRLPAKSYGTTEFDMSDERLNALIRAGKEAMKDYFDSD